jgi:ABC-2 type transport system permease protein
MFVALTKYGHAFLLGLQSNLVYRFNFAVRGFFSLFHLVVVFILWGAAFAGATSIGGFSFGQTLTYFLVMLVMQFFVGAFNEDYQISEEIRNGLINQFLLKPINYFLYRFSIFLAARLVTGALILLPLLIAVPLLRNYLVLPHDWWRLALGVPAMALSAVIQFSIAYCFGLLTFWFLEIQGFVILSMWSRCSAARCSRSTCCPPGSSASPNSCRFTTRRTSPWRSSPAA